MNIIRRVVAYVVRPKNEHSFYKFVPSGEYGVNIKYDGTVMCYVRYHLCPCCSVVTKYYYPERKHVSYWSMFGCRVVRMYTTTSMHNYTIDMMNIVVTQPVDGSPDNTEEEIGKLFYERRLKDYDMDEDRSELGY